VGQPKETMLAVPELLAADVLGEGRNQLIVYANNVATVYRLADGKLTDAGHFASTALPSIDDFNGDGKLDLALCDVGPTHQPIVRVVTPSSNGATVWERTLPPPEHLTLQKPKIAYLRSGHFSGKKSADLYCWFGTPHVRSLALDGASGKTLWELGEF